MLWVVAIRLALLERAADGAELRVPLLPRPLTMATMASEMPGDKAVFDGRGARFVLCELREKPRHDVIPG